MTFFGIHPLCVIQVPDKIMLSLVVHRLSMLDCTTKGWVLDGFPRTRAQAQLLAESKIEPNRVLFLDVSQTS